MANTKTMFKLEGSGVLKKRVPVEVNLDEIEAAKIKSIMTKVASQIEVKLNALAKSSGYDNTLSFVSFAIKTEEANPFYEEALAFINLRNKIWGTFVEYQKKVNNKEAELLTVEKILETILPQFKLG